MIEDDSLYRDFGGRIADLRNNLGMSQGDVAKQLGIAQSTYAGYELASRRVSMDMILSLSDFFEVSPDFLITGREPTRPEFEADVYEFAKLYSTLDSGDRREAKGFVRALLTKPQYKSKTNAEFAKEFDA